MDQEADEPSLSTASDGDGAHTEWEHALASSITPRTLLMRGLLESLQ